MIVRKFTAAGMDMVSALTPLCTIQPGEGLSLVSSQPPAWTWYVVTVPMFGQFETYYVCMDVLRVFLMIFNIIKNTRNTSMQT